MEGHGGWVTAGELTSWPARRRQHGALDQPARAVARGQQISFPPGSADQCGNSGIQTVKFWSLSPHGGRGNSTHWLLEVPSRVSMSSVVGQGPTTVPRMPL